MDHHSFGGCPVNHALERFLPSERERRINDAETLAILERLWSVMILPLKWTTPQHWEPSVMRIASPISCDVLQATHGCGPSTTKFDFGSNKFLQHTTLLIFFSRLLIELALSRGWQGDLSNSPELQVVQAGVNFRASS